MFDPTDLGLGCGHAHSAKQPEEAEIMGSASEQRSNSSGAVFFTQPTKPGRLRNCRAEWLYLRNEGVVYRKSRAGYTMYWSTS
jgi:hypothetical protein